MIHLGIDVSSIVYERGVSRYTTNLTTTLSQRSEIKLHLFGSSFRQKKKISNFVDQLPTSENNIASYPPKMLSLLWRYGLCPIKNFFPSLDVFHSWDWMQPPDKSLPLVSTIHDVAMLHFPESAHPDILKKHQQSWTHLRKKQAHIIAVSHSTKKDLVEKLSFPEEKITVIYEALPQETHQVASDLTDEEYEHIKKNLQLNQPYFLFVGTREPRKNLLRLIEAWQAFSDDYQLIIAGSPGWDKTSQPAPLLSEYIKKKRIRFLGRVSEKQLHVLYSEAEVFVFPSLYEGFGLPILEAFYHGTPVVTSNISSLPEVAGNAAELVDPLDVASIKKGIDTILRETKEQQAQRLKKMILRLQLFNWDSVADQTIQVYKKANQ